MVDKDELKNELEQMGMRVIKARMARLQSRWFVPFRLLRIMILRKRLERLTN